MQHAHILTVWNPVFGPRVMEMHLELLIGRMKERRAGRGGEEDVYVWWGKVRSAHRQQPLPHLQQILSIDVELQRASPERETHLYITDYRSLYVAHLGEVTAEDVRANDAAQVPEYYRKEQLNCDCWFKLWDIRRLVLDDTVQVVTELVKLRNQRYHGQPVSLYGGMVDLPLIVNETEPKRYFDDDWRQGEIGDQWWAEFDAEHAGLGVMERDLRENLFGDKAWGALESTTRTFIATAEKIFREHRSVEGFDYAAGAIEITKALESQCNAILMRALAKAPQEVRWLNVKGESVDVARDGRLSLERMGHYITGSQEVRDWLAAALTDGAWFTDQLAYVLLQLAQFRGPAAHHRRIGREEASHWRDQLMGIGCHGHLVRLAGIAPK